MEDMHLNISIFILNTNGLNTPMKSRYCQNE